MSIHNKFGQSQDLSDQMESITESRLLSLFCSKSLHWFEIEVVIEMKIIQILSMNEEVEHVVSLSNNLEPSFNPIKFSLLEELRVLEGLEQASLALGLWLLSVQTVLNPTL